MNPEPARPRRDRQGLPAESDFPAIVPIRESRHREGDRLLGAPSVGDSVRDSVGGDAALLAPFRNCQGPAVECHSAISSPVHALLPARRPSAILRRVRAVIVDPVETMLRRRTRAHVAIKRGEPLPPFLAHPNPARPVIREASRVRVMAAIPRRLPRPVFRAAGESEFRHALETETPARGRVSAPESVGRDEGDRPAIARAGPEAILPPVSVESFRDEAAESDAGKVYRFHDPNISRFPLGGLDGRPGLRIESPLAFLAGASARRRDTVA